MEMIYMELEYKKALEGIVWKLSHNWSALDGAKSSTPAKIDRNDACIRVAAAVLNGKSYDKAINKEGGLK